LDSGASCNCIPASALLEETIKEIRPTEHVLRVFNNEDVRPEGIVKLNIINPKKPKKNFRGDFYVIKGAKKAILGLRTIEQMKLATFHRDDFEEILVASVEKHLTKSKQAIQEIKFENQSIRNIVMEYADVFEETLGKLPGKVHFEIEKNAVPVRVRIRNVPIAMREALKKELDAMEQAGVIV